MPPPSGFSWIEQPRLAGMARPDSAQDLAWLRNQGIEVLISLTEDRLRRDWVNEAGLMAVHVPVEDMTVPAPEQIDQCVATIERAHERGMRVAVHCGAGLGRTGVILASYLVAQGMSAPNAIAKVRRLRPGSVETEEQERGIEDYEKRRKSS